jgi:hypothetical protein
MSIQLYKPNSKNSGCAYTFSNSISKKDGSPVFYISAIAQHSWNEERKIGSFAGNSKNPEKTVNVKINEFECGEILSAFKCRHEYSTFHAYEGNNTTIKVSPWDKSVKVSKYDPSSKSFEESKQNVPAFGFSISKGKGNTFKIGMDPGEVEVLSRFIEFFLKDFISSKIEKSRSMSRNTEGKLAPPPSSEGDDDEFADAPF